MIGFMFYLLVTLPCIILFASAGIIYYTHGWSNYLIWFLVIGVIVTPNKMTMSTKKD